jgi:hypothetical protein
MHLAHSPTLIAERGRHPDGRCAKRLFVRSDVLRLAGDCERAAQN